MVSVHEVLEHFLVAPTEEAAKTLELAGKIVASKTATAASEAAAPVLSRSEIMKAAWRKRKRAASKSQAPAAVAGENPVAG